MIYIYNMKYFLAVWLILFSFFAPAQTGLRIILIRHGEKPTTGDNLSCSGLNRALKLPEVIKAKYGIPDEIFVPAPATGKVTKNVRMLQTAAPFAVKYNLSVNTNYAVDESDKVAKALQKRSGTILVIWEHKELAAIAQALGVNGKLKWSPDDYDGIWLITFKNGKPVLTTDQEHIRPASNCAF